MTEGDLQPTAFIVMPYGTKKDPTSQLDIDFDDIWNRAFRPAAEAAGLHAQRADEERLGGFVHLAMFERLLLAEIVLADLTLASPNVMYELGIRHATRPGATLSVFAKVGQLPFDLSPIRALPYRLDDDGRLTDEACSTLVDALAERLAASLHEPSVDSPIFQLINSYPGVTLPHDVTETFQQRVRALSALSNQIRELPKRPDRSSAKRELDDLAQRLFRSPGTPMELLIDILLAYRDMEAYSEMIETAENLPAVAATRHPMVLQQLAFALNRRDAPGDVRRAINVLEGLVREHGASPETLGLLGGVHKRAHEKLRKSDPVRADAALNAAIEAYEQGFRADSRDYYPGINAVTLLLVQGSAESFERAKNLSPVVAFAVAARGGLRSKDYWDLATVLELSAINDDVQTARAAYGRLANLEAQPWNLVTTLENLERVYEARLARGDSDLDWLADIVSAIRSDVRTT